MNDFDTQFPDTRDSDPQHEAPARRLSIRASSLAALFVWFALGMSLCFWLLAASDQPQSMPAHARIASFHNANESKPDWTKIFGPNPPTAPATSPAPTEPELPRLIGIVASHSASIAMIAAHPLARPVIVRSADPIESTDYTVQSIGFDQVELSSPRGTLILRATAPGGAP